MNVLRLMKCRLRVLVALAISTSTLYAQYSVGGKPKLLQEKEYGVKQTLARSASLSDTVYLQPPSPIQQVRSGATETSELRPFHFAKSIPVKLSNKQQGQWHKAKDGSSVWLLTIRTPNAVNLGLHFSHFQLPKGAKLYAYGANGIIKGAFTEQNNSESKTLSLSPIHGDWLTLELNLEEGTSREDIQLTIDKVHYGYKDIYRIEEGRASDQANHGEPIYNLMGTGLNRLRCAPNAINYPEYSKQARATLLQVVEGTSYSTGTLINNVNNDGTAYVITAAHNLNRIYSEDIISELPNDPQTIEKVREICKTIVFFFGFDSPSSDQDIRGSEEKTLSGAELVAYNEESDMALLKITGLPSTPAGIKYIPASYNAYYAGWNINPNPQPTFFGVHHALGSTKRVCIAADQSLSIKDYSVGISLPSMDREIEWTQKHWGIQEWVTGITEAGASGSALFDADGLIIGALSGGRSSCGSPYQDTYYSVAKSWEANQDINSLKPWLDPNNTGVTSHQGYDPHQQAPLSRLSSYYGISTKGRLASYKKQENISGIGKIISIDETTKPLGVYVQLGEQELLNSKKPNYSIELIPLQDGQPSGNAIWSTSLSNYNYQAYDVNTKQTINNIRTIGLDEVELFIPTLSEDINLMPGSYLLCLRTDDDSQLDYPVLTEIYRKTYEQYGEVAWFKPIGASWTKTSESTQNPWLDLLVQGGKHGRQKQQTELDQAHYTSYVSGQKIYIYNPQGNATARIYDLMGQLLQEHRISEGENILSTDALPTQHIYIIQVKGELPTLAYKFLPQ